MERDSEREEAASVNRDRAIRGGRVIMALWRPGGDGSFSQRLVGTGAGQGP